MWIAASWQNHLLHSRLRNQGFSLFLLARTRFSRYSVRLNNKAMVLPHSKFERLGFPPKRKTSKLQEGFYYSTTNSSTLLEKHVLFCTYYCLPFNLLALWLLISCAPVLSVSSELSHDPNIAGPAYWQARQHNKPQLLWWFANHEAATCGHHMATLLSYSYRLTRPKSPIRARYEKPQQLYLSCSSFHLWLYCQFAKLILHRDQSQQTNKMAPSQPPQDFEKTDTSASAFFPITPNYLLTSSTASQPKMHRFREMRSSRRPRLLWHFLLPQRSEDCACSSRTRSR